MFRNESEVVARKAEKRYEALAKQKPAPKKKDSPKSEFDFSEWSFDQNWFPSQASTHVVPYTRYPTPESMTREIVPSIQDQALGFFAGNYVAQPTIVPRGHFEWVLELLTQPDTEEILRSSVNAASLASFANATKSPTIMQQAQAAYGSALRMTNEALRRLFHQFYGVILLVALETGRAVHPGMHELYQVMTPTSDYSVHGRQWTTRLIDIMHSTINLNQDSTTNPKIMVDVALKIDQEMEAVKGLMPPVWDYDVVHLEQPSEHLYGGTYYIYLDPWIAHMWNNVNSCRLSLYKVIRENLTKGWLWYEPALFSETEYESLKTVAEGVLLSTSTAIIASVPQITGMIPFPDLSTAKRRASDPANDEPPPVYTIQPAGTYLDVSKTTHLVHLIWPLYAAAQIDLVSPEMRQWCIDILYYVALRIGTRQAIVLADELKEMQRTGLFTTPFVDRSTLRISDWIEGTNVSTELKDHI
ncbi:hypothetical protein EK21DRAFT_56255 [Setomelanomma holmii]|uniref:Uncharacterized protein n=1 Tax=Setomelanomma holmii TaxID=210430 RepID=A0A9P4HHM0_9PLEO|nr:hypothetical protein EK21DRAFT_56255 [Setomelanomma holmii]